MLLSPDGIFLVSESDSRLGFVETVSASPSEVMFNALVPDDEPNRR